MDSPPENAVNSFDSSLPTVFPDPPTMELPSLDVFTLDPPGFDPLRLDPPRPDPPAPEPAKTSSKRTSIFQKSGSILRNPVSFNRHCLLWTCVSSVNIAIIMTSRHSFFLLLSFPTVQVKGCIKKKPSDNNVHILKRIIRVSVSSYMVLTILYGVN